MGRTKRFTARKSPSAIGSQRGSVNTSTPATIGTENVLPSVGLQHVNQENEIPAESQQPAHLPPDFQHVNKECNKYWVVEVIDDRGRSSLERLRVKDVLVMPDHKKVCVPWDENGQPVGDGSSLLHGVLGHLATNVNMFPICHDKWPEVPICYKEAAWKLIESWFTPLLDDQRAYCMGNMGKKWKDNRYRLATDFYDKNQSFQQNLEKYPDGITKEQWAGFLAYKTSEKAKKYSDINTRNRAKQTIMHTLGSKSIAKTKHELEQKYGCKISRGEMYAIAHKRKDGSFITEEARLKNEQLLEDLEAETDEDEAYRLVFGKEHPGRVRGMGYGVVPSQMLKRYRGSSSSNNFGPTQAEYDSLKQEFETMKTHMAAIIQHIGAPGLPNLRLNQVEDLGSPGIRRSSHASHTPLVEVPDVSPWVPPPPPHQP